MFPTQKIHFTDKFMTSFAEKESVLFFSDTFRRIRIYNKISFTVLIKTNANL